MADDETKKAAYRYVAELLDAQRLDEQGLALGVAMEVEGIARAMRAAGALPSLEPLSPETNGVHR